MGGICPAADQSTDEGEVVYGKSCGRQHLRGGAHLYCRGALLLYAAGGGLCQRQDGGDPGQLQGGPDGRRRSHRRQHHRRAVQGPGRGGPAPRSDQRLSG